MALEAAKTLLPILCCQESRDVQAEWGLETSSAKLRWYSNRLGATAGGRVEYGIEKWGAGTADLVSGRFVLGRFTGVFADFSERALLWAGLRAGGGAKSETRLRFAFGLPLERVIVTSVLNSVENPGFRCLEVTI